MAIQNRRGNIVDFDPHKMLPGEFAYSLDTEELYYCVAPGNVKRCATKEDVIGILETNQEAYDGLQQLLTELENETVATGILNDISDLIIKSNKNENDIVKINNKCIGTNLAINTNRYYQAVNFFMGRASLSPAGMTSLKEGDIVTLSAYLSNITVAGGVALEVAFGDSNDAEIGVITGDFVTTEGLYSFTFTIPQGAVGGDISARLQTTDSLDNGASIRNLKLELGSLVTPWKPSIYRLPALEYEFNAHLAGNVTQGNPHGVDAKADKAMGQTIAATMLNGWSSGFYYSKNDLGQVHIRGNADSGTITGDTSIATIATSHAPSSIMTVPIFYNGKGMVGLYINSLGHIKVLPPLNTEPTGQKLYIDFVYQI